MTKLHLRIPTLEKIRMIANLNKTDFARRIGISRTSYYQALWGYIALGDDKRAKIVKLAKEHGLDIEDKDLINEKIFLPKQRKSLT